MCYFQADCILLVGLAEKTPSESMSHIVKQVESISMRVQKELVLMHREGILHPTGTVKWLNALGWVSSYCHVSAIVTTAIGLVSLSRLFRCAVQERISLLKNL